MDWERRRHELETEFAEPMTVDGLTATWRIFQRKRGHRHSTDDLLTGFHALESARHVADALDLGTGIGGVGLLVLSGLLPTARLTCIEAQTQSYRLLLENVGGNALSDRVTAYHGDLREFTIDRRFPLVTGSPPYFDRKSGIVPADAQKAYARFELRGDVGDYARAARRHLTPDGLFVFCFPFAQKARAMALVVAEGFHFVRETDVVPREGLAPLFTLFTCRLTPAAHVPDVFTVRHADGTHTAAMLRVRARFGWL